MTRVSRLNTTPTDADLPAINALDGRFKAAGKLGVDDTAALNALFAAAADGAQVQFPPNRIFQYNGTLTIPDGSVVAGGGRWRNGVAHKPNLVAGHANAVIKYGNYCDLQNLYIHGNGTGNWGLQSNYTVAKPGFQNVFIEGFVQAGMVFEATQNAVLNNVTVKDCGIHYAFYNGCQTLEMFGCTGDNTSNVGGANHREIVVANSTDARLNGAVFAGGNAGIRVWGGIFEYGTGIHQVDILNTTTFGAVEFIGTVLAGNSATTTMISVGSGNAADVVLQDITAGFNGDGGTAQLVTAAAGRTIFRNVKMTGNSARNVITKTTLTGTATANYDFESAMLIDSKFQTGLYANPEAGPWYNAGGTGTVTYNGTKKRMAITCPDAAQGAFAFFLGSAHYAAQYRVIRVKFMLLNTSGSIRLSTFGGAHTIGVYGDGAYDVCFALTGDEVGLCFTSDTGSSVTAEVAYVTCEHVA